MAAVSQVSNPLHRAIIFRRTFPQLKDLIGHSHGIYRSLRGEFNKQDKQWTFPSGAIIEFGYLDVDEDKYNYQGRAFSCICFDELTQWPADSSDSAGEPANGAYLYMISRLRATEASGLRLEIRATTNPGGIGHNWVKARWRIPDDGGRSQLRDPVTGYRRVFIPARLTDNQYLAKTEYARTLDALGEADRKTLKEGRWDVYAGSVFSEWNPRIHICDPFGIPEIWPMWRGADDGFAAPACVLWFAHDKTYDRIYVTQELYRRRMTPQVMAEEVLALDGTRRLRGVIDAASFANVGMGGGRADIMNKLGCRWNPSEKGAGSRLAGKSAIHARLALREDGPPGLVIFRNCQNLIRTLPALPYSRTNPEDVADNSEDHAYEALRIGLIRKIPSCRMVRFGGI